MLALGSVGSGWVLEQSPVTLMHGHELYYALAAAYSQIHLSSHWVIYLFVSTICQRIPMQEKKNYLTRFKNEADLEYLMNRYFFRYKHYDSNVSLGVVPKF